MKIVHLNHFTLIHVFGEEAQSFLQGQLTNDIRQLKPETAQLSGYCTPKGRLLATFWILQADEGYYLFLPHSLQASIQKRLQMYVLRAKVTLKAIDQYHCIGLIDAEKLPEMFQTMPSFTLTPRQKIVLVPSEAIKTVDFNGDPNDWECTSIMQGYATVLPETQEEFVPQMLNFDLNHGVNFQKGCYTGQEIIARTHYLGKIKRRLYLLTASASENITVGMSLYTPTIPDQAIGLVTNIAFADETKKTMVILAVLPVHYYEDNSLAIEAGQGTGIFLERVKGAEAFYTC